MQNKKTVFISILILGLISIGAIFAFNKNESKIIEKLAEQNSSEAPFIREHSAKFGDNKKNITIVEFVDPECGACRAFEPAVYNIYKEYYEDVQLVIRYLANHKNSEFVIKILEASRAQNKYKEVSRIIYKYQPIWASSTNPNVESLWTYLKEVEGLDVAKLKEDVAIIDISKMLKLDREDAKTLNVRGTPSFFVNGKELKDLIYQDFLDLVETEIYK
jgi:protein-disulfide isomerase